MSEKSFPEKFEKYGNEIEDIRFPFFLLENRERHSELAVEILW